MPLLFSSARPASDAHNTLLMPFDAMSPITHGSFSGSTASLSAFQSSQLDETQRAQPLLARGCGDVDDDDVPDDEARDTFRNDVSHEVSMHLLASLNFPRRLFSSLWSWPCTHNLAYLSSSCVKLSSIYGCGVCVCSLVWLCLPLLRSSVRSCSADGGCVCHVLASVCKRVSWLWYCI